jgi:hypothetical protein
LRGDVTLTLAGSNIDAKGTLFEPTKSVKVADVTITHACVAHLKRAGQAQHAPGEPPVARRVAQQKGHLPHPSTPRARCSSRPNR